MQTGKSRDEPRRESKRRQSRACMGQDEALTNLGADFRRAVRDRSGSGHTLGL